MNSTTPRLTEQVHLFLKSFLKKGDAVIDATMGKGYDTRFLAECVGTKGRVIAVDIQQDAIEHTRERLEAVGFLDQIDQSIRLCHASHEQLDSLIPQGQVGQIHAIVYNLGYLPGTVKSITTQAQSTLRSLQSAIKCLQRGGIISVLIYTGHNTGLDEYKAIVRWADSLGSEARAHWKSGFDEARRPPVWLLIEKI